MTFIRPLLAVASGIALTLAYPRWNAGLMVWLWMFPLLFALWGDTPAPTLKPSRRFWRGFRTAYLAGAAFFIPNLSWVRHSSRVIAGAEDNTWVGWGPELMGWGAVLGLSLYLALFWGLWGGFAVTIGRPRISIDGKPAAGDSGAMFSSSLESLRSAFLCAAAWVAGEWLRGILFTGFNWNGLGVALHQNLPLIQCVDLVGVTGLAFLPVFVACIGWNTVLRFRQEVRTSRVRPHADFWAAAALVIAVFGYGAWRLAQRPGETVPLRVVLVQQNVPQWLKWEGRSRPEVAEGLYQGHGRLTEIGVRSFTPDLVIWPESALSAPFHDPNHIPFLNDVLKLGDFTLLTGADIMPPDAPPTTGAAIMRGTYDNHQLYSKVHLVPFGEYLPLREVPFVQALLGDVLPGDFRPGKVTEPFTLEKPPGIQVIPLVCFEDTDGRLARKFVRPAHELNFRGWASRVVFGREPAPSVPQLLVNLTNDGWFLQSNENEVHLANAIFRCIELRRPMARSCNTGVTCFVDEHGRIGKGDKLVDPKTGSVFVKGVLPKELKLAKVPEITFFARYGDVFSITLLVITAVGSLHGVWSARKHQRQGTAQGPQRP